MSRGIESPGQLLPPVEIGTTHTGETCDSTHLLPRRRFLHWSRRGRNARCNQAPRPGNRTAVHHARLACYRPRDSRRVVRAQRLPNQLIRSSGSRGANPLAVLASRRDRHCTHRRTPVTNTTRSAHSYSDREETHVPTREECGEIVFQQIRSLMEDGHSQTLTRAHAREIISMATLILVD